MMPTAENSDSTAGRVTRSLRKRLTSIDSDASSRPGTPAIILQTISETVTPSKRVTRKTSLSTPLATPSKSKINLDVIDSPARRSTRRRSLSLVQDEPSAQTKSKFLTVDTVKEEEITNKSPNLESRRVTRSASKSPLDITNTNSELNISKSRRSTLSKISSNQDRDPNEVISLNESIDDISEASPNSQKKKQTKVMMKKEKDIDDMVFDKVSPAKQSDTTIQTNKSISSPQSSVLSPSKSQNEAFKKKRLSIEIKRSPVNNACRENSEITEQDNPVGYKTRPEKLKNVAFNKTADENTIKSVFPKTPGLTKSKSYTLDFNLSGDVEKETSQKISGNEKTFSGDIDGKSDKEDLNEDADIVDAKTPYKLKLKAVESSTPIQSASPRKCKSLESEDLKDNTTKQTGEADLVASFPISWSQSVSGKVSETTKIDNIESSEAKKKRLEEEEAFKKKSQNSSTSSSHKQIKESEDDDDLLEEDEEYEEGEEEENERSQEKTIFIDDEAMEVAEGEESMDSEERAYLEENEVPVYGESIGSEDTGDDDDFDEEADEDDEGFIVSDTEEIRQSYDESSELDEPIENKAKEKKYKRLIKISESSNEGEETKKDKIYSSLKQKERKESLNLSNRDNSHKKTAGKLNTSNTNRIENSSQEKESNIDEQKSIEGQNLLTQVDSDLSDVEMNEIKDPVDKSRKSLSNSQESTEDTSKDKMQNEVNSIKPAKENNRKSLKKLEENEKETDTIKNHLAPHKIPLKNGNSETNDSESENKAQSKKKSLSNSKLNKTVQEEISDARETESKTDFLEISPGKSRKSTNKNNPNVVTKCEKENPESDGQDIAHENLSFSEKALFKSSKRSSLSETAENYQKDKNEQSDRILLVDNEIGGDEGSNSSTEGVSASQRKANKSLNNSQKVETAIKEKSEKYLGTLNTSKTRNTDDGEQEENLEEIGLNLSRKSLNNSKKEKRKSVLQKPKDKEMELKSPRRKSLDQNSELEETLSASEGKSLNLSKQSRKSKDRSRQSSQRNDSAGISASENEEKEFEQKESDLNHSQRSSMSQKMSLRIDSSSKDSSSDEEESNERFAQDILAEEVNDANDEEEEAKFSDDEQERQEKSTIKDFLGDEDAENNDESTNSHLNASRRSSSNSSKLDETFQMESKNNQSKKLGRSILKKSFNQSQLHESTVAKNNIYESEEEDSNNSNNFSDKEEEVIPKKKKSKRALSVSLNNIELKKKKTKGDKKAICNSFTIGVTVRNTPTNEGHTSGSGDSENENVLSEQEDLERIVNVNRIGPFKSRKSLLISAEETHLRQEKDTRKKVKRTSLGIKEQSASQSFLETISAEKKKVKQKKKSNSFCGVIAPPEAPKTVTEHQQEAQKSDKKHKPAIKSAAAIDVQRIINRCDEILEAANRAKREAKINAKKSKIKKPKWMDKTEDTQNQEVEVKIPLVSKKELKRKEKMKRELAKAIKHSNALLKTIDPKLVKKQKTLKIVETVPADDEENLSNEDHLATSTKRLPTAFLEALEEDFPPKKKKAKKPEIDEEITPPSNKENSKRSSNKNKFVISNITNVEQKKKPKREVLETATGTFVVEPSTPKHLNNQSGFRESPKTPAGFKVENAHSAGQNGNEKLRKKIKKLFTPSGEFIEQDLSFFNAKDNRKKEKSRKRKRQIEEPQYCLPKTQWTSSGIFIEEDSSPLANSTATQFLVSSLNSGKKGKNSSKIVSSATLCSAFNFKQNALFNNKIKRETSRELLHKKQRKLANVQF